MFGTLKTLPGTLPADAQHSYERFYCGLCKTLGDHHGQPARALTGHDAIFLAILADALLDQAAEPSSCRCPLLPVVHRPTMSAQSTPLRFAASMQMLLADQFLADRALDGRRTYRALRSLIAGPARKARSLLSQQGLALGDLEGFEHHQASCEVPGLTTPDRAAEPTRRALAHVFGQIVHLPGASHRLRSSASRRALAALGAAVGGAIYQIDALEDLRDDFLDGSFNPCLALVRGRLRIDPDRVAASTARLHDDLATIDRSLAELPVVRHRELLRNILAEQLASRARRAARHAADVTATRAALHAYRDAPLVQRIHTFALTSLVALIAWFTAACSELLDRKPSHPPLVPAPLPDPSSPLPAGSSPALDGGFSECPDGGLDALADAGLDPALVERCRRALPDAGLMDAGAAGHAQGTVDAGIAPHGGAGGFGNPCSDVVNACCQPFRSCDKGIGGCCDGFSGCLTSMTGCCKSCDPGSCLNGCCKSCDPGSCCKGCDPGSCCKGCDPGSCCKGCDPGSCCKGCDPGSCCKGCDGGSCCKGCDGGSCCKCAESVPTDGCGL